MPRKKPPTLDRLARTPRAVEVTGLSRRTLYRLHEDGLVNIYKIGAATYWSLDELDALVTRSRVVA